MMSVRQTVGRLVEVRISSPVEVHEFLLLRADLGKAMTPAPPELATSVTSRSFVK